MPFENTDYPMGQFARNVRLTFLILPFEEIKTNCRFPFMVKAI